MVVRQVGDGELLHRGPGKREVGQENDRGILTDEAGQPVTHLHDERCEREVADDGGDGVYARDAGTVFVVAGTVGRSLTTCSHADSEMGYFAAHHCGEEGADMKGYAVVTADAAELSVAFAHVGGASYSDTFTIR